MLQLNPGLWSAGRRLLKEQFTQKCNHVISHVLPRVIKLCFVSLRFFRSVLDFVTCCRLKLKDSVETNRSLIHQNLDPEFIKCGNLELFCLTFKVESNTSNTLLSELFQEQVLESEVDLSPVQTFHPSSLKSFNLNTNLCHKPVFSPHLILILCTAQKPESSWTQTFIFSLFFLLLDSVFTVFFDKTSRKLLFSSFKTPSSPLINLYL